MAHLKVVSFDPKRATREEWARFHAYRRKRHAETDPDDPLLADATVEAHQRNPGTAWKELAFAVIDVDGSDEWVGWQTLEFARPDGPSYEENKHILWVWISLAPAYRRQGIGRRLLREAANYAREHGKSLVVSYAEEASGRAFWKAVGAKDAQRDRQSRLDLDEVDWTMVEQWAAEGPVRSPSSRLAWFTNRIDEEDIEEWCEAFTEVWNMMPRDDLDIGDEVFNPERRRKAETGIAEGGGTILTAVTKEKDGTISGLTELGYYPEEDWMIHQWMTGVRRPYRGRGLGKWIKAAMLLRVRKEFPQVRVVRTGNAFSNAPMLSINERLGFKLYREGMEVQISLEDLEAYLTKDPAREVPLIETEDELAEVHTGMS
ncbi:MAG: GNAT family N-acetyltransferase [Thermoplasmata archaeon]